MTRMNVRLADMCHAFDAQIQDAAPIIGDERASRHDTPTFDLIHAIIYYYATPEPTELDIRFIGSLMWGGFVYVAAWNDYTGWGCQDGVTIRWATDFEDLARYALDEEDRRRWGLTEYECV